MIKIFHTIKTKQIYSLKEMFRALSFRVYSLTSHVRFNILSHAIQYVLHFKFSIFTVQRYQVFLFNFY